jgi:hypothetical protein
MNVENLFKAVKNEPDQPTLIVAALELERQGYRVTVNNKYIGSEALLVAEDNGELDLIPKRNGVTIRIEKNNVAQTFRIQFLDVDAICITEMNTAPVMYDPDTTIGFYKSGETN